MLTYGSRAIPFVATVFDATVDFNQATPTTPGVVFTPNTPALTTVLYVSSVDGSQYTYNGTAYVSAPAQPSWQITGNATTVQATNFLGTTNNVGVSFRTNNIIRMRIDAGGFVGIGAVATDTPTSNLQVRAPTNTIGRVDIKSGGEGFDAELALSTPHPFAFNTRKTAIVAKTINSSSRADLCFVLSNSTDNAVSYTTATDTKVIIKNGGNVGIGLLLPTQKLEVQGNIKVNLVPDYTSPAAAMADAALLSGTMYTVTMVGAKQLYVK